MLSRKAGRSSRIPIIRPIRPPSGRNTLRSSRSFSQRSQHLDLQPRHSRPQITYLSQPVLQRPLQKHISRLLSTESRRAIRETAVLSTKAAVLAVFLAFCGILVSWGIAIERSERQKRTPEEWRFTYRDQLRRARTILDEADEGGVVSWPDVASRLGKLLVYLELDAYKEKKIEALGKDGTAVTTEDEEKTAFDISGMSYEWRTGYVEVCMGCAAAAEHLDSSVVDITRNMVFPKDVVIGPSNPDPRPTPPYMASAPLEENCRRAYGTPESLYLRILVGIGFTTKQRLDAALGYAAWLEYKGLNESAEEVYKWGVDIAKSAVSVPPESILDPQTAVLKESANSHATPNLLRATTDLAAFYARNGNVPAALPILLSVLRARRTASIVPPAADEDVRALEQSEADKKPASIFSSILKYAKPPRFPPPPPSGDTPFVRHSDQPSCEESELMIYIGEILFATSPQSKEGLAWTRRGVFVANDNLTALEKAYHKPPQSISALLLPERTPVERRAEMERCKDCLLTGVTNWETMLQRLSVHESAITSPPAASGWRGWFGRGKSSSDGFAQLEDELEQVAALKDKILREGIGKEMFAVKGHVGGGTWIG